MATGKRIDGNQNTIVKTLRNEGVSVAITSAQGKGFPDIVVGVPGFTIVGNFNRKRVADLLRSIHGIQIIDGGNLLLELKDGTKSKSQQKLTPDETQFHDSWKGQLAIVNSAESAINLVTGKGSLTSPEKDV